MKKIRILLFSDSHFSWDSKIEEEKWFPPVCDFFAKIGNPFKLIERFLSFWDNMTQNAFRKMLRKSFEKGPYDFAIGIGDYTPGTNESGLVTEKARDEFGLFRACFERIMGSIQVYFVWGDHDTGYYFDVSGKAGIKIGTESGGVSTESVNVAEQLIGPPFGSFVAGSAKFIFISTNLVRNIDKNSTKDLCQLKYDQEDFLAGELTSWRKGPVFLFLHDPTALELETAVRKIMDSHAQKITAIIHGHMHSGFVKYLSKCSPVYKGLCCEYETILVPASWGTFGIGKGFAVMEIFNDQWKIIRHGH